MNEITWEPSSRNQGVGIDGFRIYRVKSAADRELIASLGPGTFSFRHASPSITARSDHIYGITSVTGDGRESIPAFVILTGGEGDSGR